MSDFPRNPPVPTHINAWSRYMLGPAIRQLASFPTPQANDWGTANTAVYLPLVLPWPYNVRRVMWTPGNVVGGNFDIGIYSAGGGRIYSAGSTAAAGTNSQPSYVTPTTDILLGPGTYWLAWVTDGTTSRMFGWGGNSPSGVGRLLGCYQQASALPLPATPTFAAYNSVGIPLLGITNTASGF